MKGLMSEMKPNGSHKLRLTNWNTMDIFNIQHVLPHVVTLPTFYSSVGSDDLPASKFKSMKVLCVPQLSARA